MSTLAAVSLGVAVGSIIGVLVGIAIGTILLDHRIRKARLRTRLTGYANTSTTEELRRRGGRP